MPDCALELTAEMIDIAKAAGLRDLRKRRRAMGDQRLCMDETLTL